MRYHYVWLLWSSAFFIPWALLYALNPVHRRVMRQATALTALFGLTEPIFVPAYWNPPSLFELAQRTGFDIESLIFAGAIGGIGAVLYNILTGRRLVMMRPAERVHAQHRFHPLAVATPAIVFLGLYFLPWNPIWPALAAMAAGAAAAVWCRPELIAKTFVGGGLFLILYGVFMLGLRWLAPGYIEQVWNLPALTGVLVYGIPLEELLFGFSFGMYWSGVYEHLSWQRGTATRALSAAHPSMRTPAWKR